MVELVQQEIGVAAVHNVIVKKRDVRSIGEAAKELESSEGCDGLGDLRKKRKQ